MKFSFIFLFIPIFAFSTNNEERTALKMLLENKFESALIIYEDLYKRHPDKISILQNLSNLYILMKKEDLAIEILKKWIELEPNAIYPYKILRILFLKNGKELDWLKVSANWYIKTGSENSLKALIGAKVRTGHFSQAIKIIKKNKIPFPQFENLKKDKKIKNLILLITLDTFRYDLIDKKTTPNIFDLMEESYFFKKAYAVAPITLPAHCSIFTGLYPRHNGVKDNSIYKLKDSAETIPEILNNFGYSSYAFISSYLLNRKFGLNQGFKIYQDNFKPLDRKSHFPSTRRAEDTISEAMKFLNNAEEENLFFFIHLYDTHAPYEPPFPFDEAYSENLYKGEAVYIDFVLGNFFNQLKKANLYEKSTIIIISDHGESLGEFGEPTHGFLLYEPTLHIPFIIHLKGQRFKKEISTLASQVDLFPTLLSYLKIDYKKTDGEDLFKIKSERNIFSETELPLSFNWSSLFKIYKDDYSYISKPSNKLFLKDKQIKNDSLKKEMEKELEKYKEEKPLWDVEEEVLDEETIRNLKSLGYHHSFTKSKVERDLPNPEEKMDSLILYQRAISFEDDENFSELYKITKILEEKEKDSPQFLSLCSEWYHKIGKEEEAINSIKNTIKIDKNFAQGWFYYGFLNEKKDKRIAKEYYKKAIEIQPNHFLARYNLSRLYLIEKDFELAEKEMLEVLKIFPQHLYTLNNLGYLYFKRDKDCQKAKKFIEQAYKFKEDDDVIKISYASVLCNCGEKEKGMEILKKASPNLEELKKVLNECK